MVVVFLICHLVNPLSPSLTLSLSRYILIERSRTRHTYPRPWGIEIAMKRKLIRNKSRMKRQPTAQDSDVHTQGSTESKATIFDDSEDEFELAEEEEEENGEREAKRNEDIVMVMEGNKEETEEEEEEGNNQIERKDDETDEYDDMDASVDSNNNY
jgi:hypothetical protein